MMILTTFDRTDFLYQVEGEFCGKIEDFKKEDMP